MSLVTINDVIAQFEGKALAGLVCLGWEEVRAFIEAAEHEACPVVLMVGPSARAAMPLSVWGKMLRVAAQGASVPIIAHLDHGKNLKEIKSALDYGFSSVMYDGSALPLDENIALTAQIVELARKYGVSVEGEIGFVGYAEGKKSHGTDPAEAARFARETTVDLMAVSVGNTHLQTQAQAKIDWSRLAAIAKSDTALAIHGGSGIAHSDRQKMARLYNVRKFNIGTQMRTVFGQALRQSLADNPDSFDHLRLMSGVHAPLVSAARMVIRRLKENSNG